MFECVKNNYLLSQKKVNIFFSGEGRCVTNEMKRKWKEENERLVSPLFPHGLKLFHLYSFMDPF